MNITLWILQGLMAFIFLFSGFNKAYFNEETLVKKGQTGVEGLSRNFIKFIGIAEVLGAIGLIVPMLLNQFVYLTPLASVCLGLIMIPAAIIHYRRNEKSNVLLNIAILIICFFIGYYRM